MLGVYWKAWGSTLAFVVISSIILMQASKNLSDAWLAHWVESVTPANSTAQTDGSKLLGSRYYTASIESNVKCLLQKFFSFEDMRACASTTFGSFRESYTTSFNLVIYFLIAVSNSIFTLIRAFSFAYAGVKAAKIMHAKLLSSVFNVSGRKIACESLHDLFRFSFQSEFSFFDVTPIGRILNRFSSDTYTVDDSLPFILNILLAQLAGLTGLCD